MSTKLSFNVTNIFKNIKQILSLEIWIFSKKTLKKYNVDEYLVQRYLINK